MYARFGGVYTYLHAYVSIHTCMHIYIQDRFEGVEVYMIHTCK